LSRALRFAVSRAVRPRSEFRRVFDADFYAKAYADVAASGVNPLWHFVTVGAFEGCNPNPLFDTSFYLGQCANPPRIDALSDYLQRGCAKGLRPHPLFDSVYYLRRYPEVQRARMNPLVHYLLHGFSEGRKPTPLFAPDYYLKVCPSAEGLNPLVHFADSDASQFCNPHPLFDCQAYRREHPESAGNPLASYLTERSRSLDTEAGAPATFEAAQFAVQEVEVLVAFPGSGFEQPTEAQQQRIYAALQAEAACEGFRGEVAVLWRTVCGKKFLCAPHQRRFFECTPFDQLAAQINGQIEIGAAAQIR